ncbi:MAG TPA: hypothetical protein VGH90_00175 [Chthoniobacteraceae bacterium]|jgi:hypothetical protein
MPKLAVFRDFDPQTNLPRYAWVALEKHLKPRELRTAALAIAKNPKGSSYLVAPESADASVPREWVALLDIDVESFSENEIAETLEAMTRLQPLTSSLPSEPPHYQIDAPKFLQPLFRWVAAIPCRYLGWIRPLEHESIKSWQLWFKNLSPAKKPLATPEADDDPVQIQFQDPQLYTIVVVLLAAFAALGFLSSAWANPLLGTIAYGLRLALFAAMIGLGALASSLSPWLGQTRSLAICEAVLLLCLEAMNGRLFSFTCVQRCLVAAVAVYGIFFAIGKLGEYFESSVAAGVLTNGLFVIFGWAALGAAVLWIG